ncbi:MAG: thiamine biosynthesis protein ThiS [Gloeocapsa sp. DLM2.Bin57]|nr:MAG: thiamine biosynthesis protein ThiS [Gloeocapsa sp. DLM2.Bin57]
MTQINVQVNGETHQSSQGITLPQLLEQLDLNPRLVVVEYNGEILHKQYWQQTQIKQGDRLEVVTIVGGG